MWYGRPQLPGLFILATNWVKDRSEIVKYSVDPYVDTKSYAEELRRKLCVFAQRSGRKQTLFLTVFTPDGIKDESIHR